MMSAKLKPLADQSIVITGGTSGIGLATALRAARAGAAVTLAARNEGALRRVVEAIEAEGGRATFVACDVAEDDAPERIGETACNHFGGFDTWVNNAAAPIYGRLLETSPDEHRRLFDVGYFGLVQGSIYAARELSSEGGALINVGSILSDRAVPIQGAYSAMKHAVAGFTDALRMELEMDKVPVSVTLIKPSGMDTPYPEHSRNKMDKPASIPPIVYDPRLTAKAICFAAAHPRRSMTVGGQGFLFSMFGNAAPRATDRIMESFMDEEAMSSDTPPDPDAVDNLFEPREDERIDSNQNQYVRRQSLALEAQMRPVTTAAIVGGAAATAAMAVVIGDRIRRRRSQERMATDLQRLANRDDDS